MRNLNGLSAGLVGARVSGAIGASGAKDADDAMSAGRGIGRVVAVVALVVFGVAPATALAQAGGRGSALVSTPVVMPIIEPPPNVRQAGTAPTLTLEIMARRITADGGVGGMAGDHGIDAFDSHVWTTSPGLCGLGASNDEPVDRAPHVGWKFSGRVLARTPGAAGDVLSVRIEWERVWDAGTRLAAGRPGGSQTVNMREDDVLVLDRVTPTTTGLCNVVEIRLEAAVTSRRFPTMVVGAGRGAGVGARGGRGGAGGVAGGRSGAATGAVSGGGGGTGTAGGRGVAGGSGRAGDAGAAGTGAVAGGRGGTGTILRGSLASDLAELGEALRARRSAYRAEIWLVHRLPDGVERVQQQTLTFGSAGTDWSFPPVIVPRAGTARGDESIGVRIEGHLTTVLGQGTTAPHLRFTISRDVRSQEAIYLSGRSATVIPMPGAGEVIAFELPPLRKEAEELLKNHRFSLRLRVTPVER
jgi:hypothetical protein